MLKIRYSSGRTRSWKVAAYRNTFSKPGRKEVFEKFFDETIDNRKDVGTPRESEIPVFS